MGLIPQQLISLYASIKRVQLFPAQEGGHKCALPPPTISWRSVFLLPYLLAYTCMTTEFAEEIQHRYNCQHYQSGGLKLR